MTWDDLTPATLADAPEAPSWFRPLIAGMTLPASERDRIPAGARHSAVLIGLADGPELLLTHRAPTMRTHSGQMAFPGGARDRTDPTPVATALREAREETALTGARPLATGAPLYIDRTNFLVVPVLAWLPDASSVHSASPENDWVGMVPLAELADPARRLRVAAHGWSGPAFRVNDHLLWGFTGGVVDRLLRIGGWERPWDERPVDLFAALAASANNEGGH